MKKQGKLAIALMVIIVAGIYYYVELPAFNIHSSETWFFVMALAVIGLVDYTMRKKPGKGAFKTDKGFRSILTVLLALDVYKRQCLNLLKD